MLIHPFLLLLFYYSKAGFVQYVEPDLMTSKETTEGESLNHIITDDQNFPFKL